MAYAETQSVVVRGGGLLGTLGPATTPSIPSVDEWLDQVAAEIDGYVRGAGYAAPVSDPGAVQALVGANADGALCIALAAKYNGAPVGPNGTPLPTFTAALDRYNAALRSLMAGTHPALLILRDNAQGGADAGNTAAGSLWTDEPEYLPEQFQVGVDHNVNLHPPFYKGMRL